MVIDTSAVIAILSAEPDGAGELPVALRRHSRSGLAGDASWAMVAVIIVDVWLATPFVFLVVSAGLTAIPFELHESAALDGATRRQSFLRNAAELPRSMGSAWDIVTLSPEFKDLRIPHLDLKMEIVFIFVPGIYLGHLVDVKYLPAIGECGRGLVNGKPMLPQHVSIGVMTVPEREADVRGISKVSDVNEEVLCLQFIILPPLAQLLLDGGKGQIRNQVEEDGTRGFGRPVLA